MLPMVKSVWQLGCALLPAIALAPTLRILLCNSCKEIHFDNWLWSSLKPSSLSCCIRNIKNQIWWHFQRNYENSSEFLCESSIIQHQLNWEDNWSWAVIWYRLSSTCILAEQLEFGHKPINITSATVKGRCDNKWTVLNVYRAKPLGR